MQGTFEGGELTLRLQPGRIDWLLGSAASIEQQAAQLISSVGRFDEVRSRFSGLIERWLPMSPSLSRIAFGGVVLLPAPDRVTGYRMLAPYLPSVKLDPEGSSELLYRINRPRMSHAIKDLRLNRLSTWAVGAFQITAFSITGTGKQATVTAGERVFACRIELDINTVAEYPGEFIPEHSQQTFNELVQLGVEIIEKGDVP
jgi:hypothetical protein